MSHIVNANQYMLFGHEFFCGQYIASPGRPIVSASRLILACHDINRNVLCTVQCPCHILQFNRLVCQKDQTRVRVGSEEKGLQALFAFMVSGFWCLAFFAVSAEDLREHIRNTTVDGATGSFQLGPNGERIGVRTCTVVYMSFCTLKCVYVQV